MSPLTFGQDQRPRSKRPPRADYLRIFLMAMMLLMLLAVIVNPGVLYHVGLPREEPSPTRPAPRPSGSGYPVSIYIDTRPATQPDTPAAVIDRPDTVEPSAWPDTRPVGLPLGIDRTILNDVEDLQPIEAGPYFEALKAVRALPEAAFTQPGLPAVEMQSFLDKDGPRRFRGRLVTVRGNLRRLERQPLGENPSGLFHVYEGQVRHDALSFYTVVVTDPPGSDVVAGKDVSVTGVFLKLWVYRDRAGTLRQTPLILGRRIEAIEPPYPEQYRVPIMFGTVAGLIVVAVVTVGIVLYRRGDRRFDKRFMRRGGDVSLDDLDLPAPSAPEDEMKRLAEADASAEPDDGRDQP